MADYRYLHGDSATLLKSLESNYFKLIMTSPPYNVGKEYETKQDIEQYLEQQCEVLDLLIDKLHPNGSICWQIGNYVNSGEIFPLDVYYYSMFKERGLQLRNRIIWHFAHGLHSSKRFSGRYEVILWFTKSDDYTFNLDDVRVKSKYPGKRHFKGPKKGQLSSNPKGKNPSDYWEILLKDWEKEIWNVPNVKSNHVEKTEHPCQYPIELVERCVLALTDENDWVLDPYAGVGSTLLGSLLCDRNAIAIEKEERYVNIGRERVKKFESGELTTRPLDKPIYDHTKSPLSRVPDSL